MANKVKDPLSEVEVVDEVTQVAVVPRTVDDVQENTSVALAMPESGFDDVEGDFDDRDVRAQYLSLVARTGELVDQFGAGSFVLNKELKVGNGKDKPVNITILGIRKHYEELVPFGSEETPQLFDTKEQAVAAGFSTEWDAKKRVGAVLTCRSLVEVPDQDFSMYEFGGKFYAEATWVLHKTAYKAAAIDIIKARSKGHLKDGLWKGGWLLTSALKQGGTSTYYVPVLKKNGRHPDDFVKWVESEVL
jgi:hypothetical protein